MLLMVSVQNLPEAMEALRGGADIVDVKNLQEALVGSAHPMTVKAVRDAIPTERHASVTLGVVPNQAGTVAMAVYAAGIIDATSVKVGFMKTEYPQAVETLLECREALEGFDTKLIGSLFADNPLYDGLKADHMVDLAKDGKCDGWLIDTLTKDGRNLFDFMPEEQLREMTLQGKLDGMSVALSGHLRMEDVDELARINPDIVGVRGGVCRLGDRSSDVHRDAVAEFRRQLDLRETGQISVREARIMSGQGAGNGASDGAVGSNGWFVIDGTGKTCAGILAALNAQIEEDGESFIEVIIPDVLNTYDVVVWAEERSHDVLTQRKDESGATRMLIKP